METVVSTTFPLLLNLANNLLDENRADRAEMMRTIIKAYKHAIYMQIPVVLTQQDSIVGWCTFFLRVISTPVPPEAMNEDLELQAHHPCWNSKKWSYGNLNRLFVR
jgi:hypothetical protein